MFCDEHMYLFIAIECLPTAAPIKISEVYANSVLFQHIKKKYIQVAYIEVITLLLIYVDVYRSVAACT